MDNRRLLLAAFLSALILIVWNVLFPPPVRRPPAEVPAAERSLDPRAGEQDPGASPDGPQGSAETPADAPGSLPADALAAPSAPEAAAPVIDFSGEVVEAQAEELAVIETEAVRVEFSNRGAQLVSFQLKQHLTSEGESLELLKERGADPYPFAVVVDGARAHALNSALFVWEQEQDLEGRPLLRFRHRSSRGSAEKVFRLTAEDLLDVEITVVGESRWSVFMGPGLRAPKVSGGGRGADDRFLQRGVGYRRGEETRFLRPRKKEEALLPALGLRWVTLENNFFLNAVIPEEGVQEVLIRPVLQRANFESDKPRFFPVGTDLNDDDVVNEQFVLVEAAGERLRLLALFDAKRYVRLADLPYGLEKTVRWGWFGFLAKPLYFGIEWSYQNLTPNYGWAIIFVTFLIRLVFFPLTHKSQESMAKMQELNPKVQAIRSKYRSKLKDRQGRPNVEAQRQMNDEMMKVYKGAGVNPASGCLPILLQMPVFFAFFRVLSTAVELRNAPWIGWIGDLSSRDPYFVLPIIMGATSVGMQRMMPSSPDAMQRRMLQMMPIVFTVFALYFPSGLVLYWLTNNLLSMAQQALLLWMKKRKATAEPG